MVNVGQNVAVVTVMVIASLLFMAGMNRAWPQEKRRNYNDLIGWQLSTLGTTYAVILGFMLYTVWTTFGEADLNVDLEANSILNIYRLGEGFPEPQRTQLQTLALSYADAVVNRDWPQWPKAKHPTKAVGSVRRCGRP
jgi:hypothetical protein